MDLKQLLTSQATEMNSSPFSSLHNSESAGQRMDRPQLRAGLGLVCGLIPAPRRLRQVICVGLQGQPGLHTEFQAS